MRVIGQGKVYSKKSVVKIVYTLMYSKPLHGAALINLKTFFLQILNLLLVGWWLHAWCSSWSSCTSEKSIGQPIFSRHDSRNLHPRKRWLPTPGYIYYTVYTLFIYFILSFLMVNPSERRLFSKSNKQRLFCMKKPSFVLMQIC